MNCLELATKAANGRLTTAEILQAFDSEQKIREALIVSGKTDNLEQRVASLITEQAIAKKVEAARMKRQIAQTILVRGRLDAQIKTFKASGLSPVKSIIALWEGTQRSAKGARSSGYAQGQAYEASWLGSFFSNVEKDKPHIMKLMRDKSFDNDVTKELWELRKDGNPGATGNSDAAWLAKELSAHMELARTELNRMGAGIGKLDGYAGPQVHDDLAMLKVSSAKWIDDILPHLDQERTFPDATSQAEVREILEDVYNTIITGVSNRITPLLKGERVGPANLATKLGKNRVLHFRDAEAAMQYRDTYGRGSTIQGILGQLKHHAHTAGAMNKFGPNPESMILAIAERERLNLKTQVDGMAPGKARDEIIKHINDLSSGNGEVARLNSTIASITGTASRPVNITAATVGNNIRAVQAFAKLGGAVITAMPTDTLTMGAAAMFRGQGFWNGIFRSLGEMGNRAEGKEIGYLLGEGFDGISGELSSAQHDGPAGVMSRMAQTFYKWSGLSGWTDTARSVSARVTAAHLGMNVGKTFGQLDPRLRHVLRLNNIDAPKWEAIRSAGYKEVNGNTYLTPDLIRGVSDAHIESIVSHETNAVRALLKAAGQEKVDAKIAQIIARARRDLELDLHRYYADEASYSVVETDAASRRITAMGTRPGTVAGEAVRYIMQFKGFPIAFGQRILGRAVMNAPTGKGGQLAHMGTLLAGLTAAGYMSMTVKDMARGIWPPRRPFSETDPYGMKTFGAAALQGGALGIYGDFLFGGQSRFGQGPVETLSGPGVSSATDLYNIWQDARQGDPKAGHFLNFAINNTPFINLFYTRTALDILFLNSLREWASPGTLKRQETKLRKERGQHYSVPRTLQQAVQ